jgi:glycosyltransferase involved in cell wall biosynthesis
LNHRTTISKIAVKTRTIAIVYDCIYPYIKGGAERRFYELATRMVNDHTEVHLYGMKSWDGPDVIKRDGLTLHGICKARPVYARNGRRSVIQAVLFGISSCRLLREKFDVIDCCGFPYFSLFPCKRLYSTWLEVWGRDYWFTYLGPLGVLGYGVEWLAGRLPDEIIAVSESTKERLLAQLHVRGRIDTLPGGIDTTAIGALKPAEPSSEVMFVGRLVNFKNVDVIMQAVAFLRDSGVYVRCDIVGDGPELQTLQQLANALDIDDRVRLLGFLEDSDDVYRLMKASKVLVLPSSREGFGLVVLEANACGLPVITIDHPDNAAARLIAEGCNGSVVPLEVTAIASAIRYWVLAPTSDLSEYVRNYDWEVLAMEQAEIYGV